MATSSVWQQTLENFPSGIALLDAETGKTRWTNKALIALLQAAADADDVIGWLPEEYLPGLSRAQREEAMATLHEQSPFGVSLPPQRLSFVHRTTRNIAYWEWSLQTVGQETDTASPPACLLLTVQSVSDLVMNERLLATTARTAERSRRRAEALGRLTQLVNASLRADDLLRAITEEAAAYLGSPHAGVLLVAEDRLRLDVGYSLGLLPQEQPLLTRENTVAGQAISQGKTLVARLTPGEWVVPLLDTGQPPVALITTPIAQNDHVYGVVEVYFTTTSDVPEDALSLLKAFADQTAIALSRADLYARVAAQQEQLQLIFDNAPVGIVYCDAAGTALAANSAANRYSAEESRVVGLPIHRYLPGLPPDIIALLKEQGEYRASQMTLYSASAGEVVCDVSLLPIRDNGRLNGLLLLLFDVTELVRARQEADIARCAAEDALAEVRATQTQMVQMEKMRAVGELASGVAHDFNNALMGVLGYTELAEEELHNPEALKAHLAIIKKAALDAASTVQRLQRFARKRVALSGEATDLNAVVQDVVDLTRPRWRDAAQKEGRSYEVRTHLEPVPSILAEPSGLREVLINMIVNALYAMPEGGTLTLSTHAPTNQDVEICVEDTGQGMTSDVLSRIFDPFFTTRGVEGTGLGLAVSWTIIQRHGGHIDVQSTPGKGTRFTISLPVRPVVEPRAAQSVFAPPSAQKGIKILAVDDEPLVASVLNGLLTRRGYEVTLAYNAGDALHALQQNGPFQLMLTDHGMPGLNGLQLIAEVKRQYPDLPVILLTGWGETVLQAHVAEELPAVILGKPINQNDLLEAVAKTLQGTDDVTADEQAGTKQGKANR